MFPAARDGDAACMRVDRVFHQFRDRFQRVRLRKRDDGDRVPVVADTQPPTLARLGGLLFTGSFAQGSIATMSEVSED